MYRRTERKPSSNHGTNNYCYFFVIVVVHRRQCHLADMSSVYCALHHINCTLESVPHGRHSDPVGWFYSVKNAGYKPQTTNDIIRSPKRNGRQDDGINYGVRENGIETAPYDQYYAFSRNVLECLFFFFSMFIKFNRQK